MKICININKIYDETFLHLKGIQLTPNPLKARDIALFWRKKNSQLTGRRIKNGSCGSWRTQICIRIWWRTIVATCADAATGSHPSATARISVVVRSTPIWWMWSRGTGSVTPSRWNTTTLATSKFFCEAFKIKKIVLV